MEIKQERNKRRHTCHNFAFFNFNLVRKVETWLWTWRSYIFFKKSLLPETCLLCLSWQIYNLLKFTSDNYHTSLGRFTPTLPRHMSNKKLMKEIWHFQCSLKSKQCLRKTIREKNQKSNKQVSENTWKFSVSILVQLYHLTIIFWYIYTTIKAWYKQQGGTVEMVQ